MNLVAYAHAPVVHAAPAYAYSHGIVAAPAVVSTRTYHGNAHPVLYTNGVVGGPVLVGR